MSTVTETMNRMFRSRRFDYAAFAVIAGMILIAYSNTFTASFHFDDNPAIVENTFIKRVTWDNFVSLLGGTRPVINLTLMLNYSLSGLNVVGWHVFNVFFHIMNGFFVYLFMKWTLTMPLLADRYGERAGRMALFGALLFGLHPVQTEAVTYIISRTELVATFFYLATILLFIKGAMTKKFGFFIAAFFTSCLGMGSKEWMVTIPAVLLLYDYLFLSNSTVKPLLSRGKAQQLKVLSWGVLVYTLSTSPLSGAGFGISGQNNITPWTYLLTSVNVLWTYVRLLLLPINQNLDYTYPVAKTLFELPTILSFVGHVLVVAACFWVYRKKGWTLIPFGAAWFYITLSPTQSFVPILDVIFEHRLYQPSVGFFLAFTAAFEGVFEWLERRKASKQGDRAVQA